VREKIRPRRKGELGGSRPKVHGSANDEVGNLKPNLKRGKSKKIGQIQRFTLNKGHFSSKGGKRAIHRGKGGHWTGNKKRNERMAGPGKGTEEKNMLGKQVCALSVGKGRSYSKKNWKRPGIKKKEKGRARAKKGTGAAAKGTTRAKLSNYRSHISRTEQLSLGGRPKVSV